MKKIVFAAIVALAAILGGYQFSQSQEIENLSDLTKANVEALALDPIDLLGVTCVPAENKVCIVYLSNKKYVEATNFKAE